ncbi:MAG: TlpA disulfide reductase family protein [Crocinitomicaceae bacterium]|nr:TlpA disulfide reductase family protein [Crocinitomicaceae bacterium]
MKTFFTLAVTAITFFSFGQTPIDVKIRGNIFNLKADTIVLAQRTPTGYVDLIKAPISKKGDFKMAGKLPSKDYYVLRVSPTEHLNLILRENSDIQVYGDGKDINSFNNVIGSDETVNLNQFINEIRRYNYLKDSASAYLQQFPDQAAAVNQSFTTVSNEFTAKRQHFIAQNNNSPALIAVLQTLDVNNEVAVFESIVKQLVAGFDGSPTVEQIKIQFKQMQNESEEKNMFSPGKMAPDFTQTKPDGTTMKLSDLRGQVVLLDFWASWCGPCRKENPNVVKVYKKYNKDGFTVMNVSLDKSREAWLAAIEKDGLVWPNHVSDLKFWSNEAAQLYKVSSIPFTVLIDKNGKILGTNIRGEALGDTLKTIFGH